jgi:hypothetical protein
VSDLGVGDAEIPTLTVQPADADTAATLVVHAPDGTSTAVPVTGGTLTAAPGSSPVEYAQTWTATDPVTYNAPGRWVLTWTVTGTGEGAEDVEVWVVASPLAGGPTWTPGRSHVAAYVPHRTLARSVSSTVGAEDEYVFGFDQTTTPPGSAVDRLIVDAVARVTARATNLQPSMFDLARATASLMAAVWVERSWPQDDQALNRANDMEKQANQLLADLIAANDEINGTSYGLDAAPVWSFPSPDPRYDNPLYW